MAKTSTILKRRILGLLTGEPVEVHLFANNVKPNGGFTLDDFTEVVDAWYAPRIILPDHWPVIENVDEILGVTLYNDDFTEPCWWNFLCPQTIYGFWFERDDELLWSGRFDSAPVILPAYSPFWFDFTWFARNMPC